MFFMFYKQNQFLYYKEFMDATIKKRIVETRKLTEGFWNIQAVKIGECVFTRIWYDDECE